jgi:hypothetical protein
MIREGDWLQTYTGKKFWPLDPSPEDVCICDIANALAKQCRYNGAISEFYSVAQHSLIMSCHASPGNRLWALLHDAAEAYLGDTPRPVKNCIPQIREVEEGILRAVAEAFGLAPEIPQEVKWLDNRMLATEAAQLIPAGHDDWLLEAPPLPIKIVPVPWGPALHMFLQRFAEITRRKPCWMIGRK